MAKIKHDHAVTQMALSNLDAWVNSPRVLSMIVCMVVYCIMQGVVDQAGFWVAGIELQLTLPEKLFVKLYNSFYNMGSLLFLVMVSEIPRRIPFQHMMLIRSTRRKWITSQCLYCALMVMLTILLLCMTYMLVVFPDSPLGNTFTDNEFIAAGYYEQEDSFIPAYIRSQFTPWSAVNDWARDACPRADRIHPEGTPFPAHPLPSGLCRPPRSLPGRAVHLPAPGDKPSSARSVKRPPHPPDQYRPAGCDWPDKMHSTSPQHSVRLFRRRPSRADSCMSENAPRPLAPRPKWPLRWMYPDHGRQNIVSALD